MRSRRVVLAIGMLLAAACVPEPTAVRIVPATVLWLEWPKAVTLAQPGALRVTGYAPCGFRAVFGVTVSGSEIRVNAEGHGSSDGFACPADAIIAPSSRAADGGAGYDTLLPLPGLTAPSQALPAYFRVWAPMQGPGLWAADDRSVGTVELRATTDTATQFAGGAYLTTDTAGCWRMRPWSRYPVPQWVFSKPVPLTPRWASYYAYVTGYFVRADPPICGDSIAARATRLEVDVTPPLAASLSPSR